MPRVEEEFEVEGRQGFADVVHGGFDLSVVLAVFAAFMRAFHEDGAVGADGGEGAGDDFVGFSGFVVGDGAEFGDVEELKGAAAVAGGDVDAAAVGEEDFFLLDFDALVVFLEHGSDLGEFMVKGGGGVGEMVEVLVGVFDFVEFAGGIRQGAVDDACFVVGDV